ncbi:MAG: PHB depolymerase family esterase [Anaerolineaceae bacterium]
MKWIRALLWFVGIIALLAIILLVVFHFLLDRTNGEILSAGILREYLLYVPSTYNPQTPTPLVISIHGYAEWPAHQMQLSGWNNLADEYGFIVVYPSGTGFPKHWHDTGHSEVGEDPLVDLKFISDLIDELEQEYSIDKTRIYANGLSNGGGMSVFLACTLSNRIAAVGIVSGAYLVPEQECLPSRPVPLIAFHGTSDPIVPYHGGPSESFELPFPDVPAWIKDWAVINGCNSTPQTLPSSGSVSGIVYEACDRNAGVVFYTIDEGGHAWPGGEPLPEWLVGETTQDIDATRVMWEFFQQHSLSE